MVISLAINFPHRQLLPSASQCKGLEYHSEASKNLQIPILNYIKQFTGLFKDNPLLSISLAVCLFSMAGVPPLLGFFGKQQILYASISQNYTFISIVAIVMSVISAYYYLNIIKISHFNTYPDHDHDHDHDLDHDHDSKAGINATATERDNFNNKRHFLLGHSKVLQNTHSYAIAVLTLIIYFFLLTYIYF